MIISFHIVASMAIFVSGSSKGESTSKAEEYVKARNSTLDNLLPIFRTFSGDGHFRWMGLHSQ